MRMFSRKQLYRHGIFALLFLMIFVWTFLYLLRTSADVPFMDYYQKSTFIRHAMDGSLSLSDFWNTASVHKNPVSGALFFLNLKLFHWNALVSVYVGLALSVLTVLLLYAWLRRYARAADDIPLQIAGGLLALTVLCFGQWAIVTNEFSSIFSLRVLVFMCVLYAADRFFLREKKRLATALLLGVGVSLSFILIGQMYFFGVFVAVCCAAVFQYCVDRSAYRRRGTGILYALVVSCMLVGLLVYFYGVDFSGEGGLSGSSSSPLSSLLSMLMDGTFLRSVCVAISSSLFQTDTITSWTYILGGGYLALTLVSVGLYFWKKLYRRSLFPLMLVLYSAVNIVMFMYSRIHRFGLPGMAVSRYIIDTKLLHIGMICIWCMLFGVRKRRSIWAYSLAPVFVLLLAAVTIASNGNQYHIGPYRKAAFQYTRSCMLFADQMADEDLSINQAHSAATFRETVKVMKQYSLGVFRNDAEEIGSTLDTVLIAGHYWTDHWMGKHVYICIRTGEEGTLHWTMYNPREDYAGKTFSISCEGEENQVEVGSGMFEFDLPVPASATVTLKVDLSELAAPIGGDSRGLSLVLRGLTAQ